MSNRDNLELIVRYSKEHLKQSVSAHVSVNNFGYYPCIVAIFASLAFLVTPGTWHVANVLLWFYVAFGFVMRLASLFFVSIKREVENDNGTAGGEVYQYLAYICTFKKDRTIASVLIVVAFVLTGHFGKAIVYGIACASTWFVAYFYWRKSYPAALAAAQMATERNCNID